MADLQGSKAGETDAVELDATSFENESAPSVPGGPKAAAPVVGPQPAAPGLGAAVALAAVETKPVAPTGPKPKRKHGSDDDAQRLADDDSDSDADQPAPQSNAQPAGNEGNQNPN